ncbi:MAG: hypothetical protein KGD67_10865 [Candidatus Lokiarchaeota archaeon]|nr:hypothetical protein [Candidatus Lokiarchaeota archaeon]
MVRELTQNRWNWSQKDQKWVFIESSDNEKLIYHYQVNPPKEFTELTMKIKTLNDKLIACIDTKENSKIFSEMMKVSKRMQSMAKSC